MERAGVRRLSFVSVYPQLTLLLQVRHLPAPRLHAFGHLRHALPRRPPQHRIIGSTQLRRRPGFQRCVRGGASPGLDLLHNLMQLGRVMQQQSIGVDVGQGELAAHSSNVMFPFQLALPNAFSEILTRLA